MPRRIQVGFGALLLVLSANAIVLVRNVQQLAQNEQRITHTYQVIATANQVLSTLKDAETGQRGYLITGNDRFLEPYNSAIAQIDSELSRLKTLTVDNSVQQSRLQQLDQTVDQKLAELRTTIDLRRTQGEATAARQVRTERGKQIMDTIRSQVGQIVAEENRLLEIRAQQSEQSFYITVLTFAIATGLSALFLVLVYQLIRRDRIRRDRSEAQLQQYKDIFESVQLGLFVDRPEDRRLQIVNPALATMHGYAVEELIGKPVVDLIAPEQRSIVPPTLSEADQQNRISIESVHVRKDGTLFPVQIDTTVVREASGAIRYRIVNVQDISARQQAARDIDRAQEQFRLAIFNAPLPIILHAEGGEVLQINRTWMELSGYSQAELPTIQHWARRAYDGESLQAMVIEGINQMYEITSRVYEGEFKIKTADGQYRIWAFFSAPLGRGEDGRSLVVTTAIDVTERRQAEAEIRRLNETLEQQVENRTRQWQEATAEMEAFTYSVSHDLRAPLRTMQGFAQALLEDYGDQLDTDGHTYLQYVIEGALQMDTLISDLLAYSRLGRVEVDLQPVDLNTTIDDALRTLTSEIQARHAQIEVAARLPEVLAHRSTLSQVITNLISNAIKFVPADTEPRIKIWAESEASRIRVWIEDNGIGIAPEHQDRIFRVFERLHGIEAYPGTGVGLAIVCKGMSRMGGTSGVVSQFGAGSRFWIALPKLKSLGDQANTKELTGYN